MLTEAELVAARRHCGYPAHGAQAPGGGWYFSPAYGALEYRLANLVDSEEVVLRGYVGTIEALEEAVPASADGLDVSEAGSYRRNASELAERIRLLDEWRRRLCAFLGVPAGPGLGGRAQCIV
ncbi:MAG: hypothetical protein ACU0B1_10520 [Thermohalobaculum sp.]